jgi:hypothetical protein
LTSKIINMAERMKDPEDLKLEGLFREEPVADDGFSVSVVARVRRQVWVRRLSLPVAIAIGSLIGIKPLLELAGTLPQIFSIIPVDKLGADVLPIDALPQGSTLMIGATLIMAVMFASRLLEE